MKISQFHRRDSSRLVRTQILTTLGSCAPLAAIVLCSMTMLGQGATTFEIHLPSYLLVKGAPDSAHTILYTTQLGNPYGWQFFTNLTLSGVGVGTAIISTTDSPRRFYQAVAGPARMVYIPSGTFTMGSPKSEPERQGDSLDAPRTKVTLTRGFFMGKYEVTQGEYEPLTDDNPSLFRNGISGADFGGSGDAVTDEQNHPVEHVSWNEADGYCTRLTRREREAGRLPVGYVYRLPTEAEWEYACRAGTTTAFHYGPALRSEMANFDARHEYDATLGTIDNPEGTYLGRTTPVGIYAPNGWGLYDMHGNVFEMCLDAFGLPGGSVSDPKGSTNSSHGLRGGSCIHSAWFCRSAGNFFVREGQNFWGFRVVLAPE